MGRFLAAALACVIGYNALRWGRDAVAADAFRARAHATPPPLPTTPTLSILVAAWNEAAGIERHIRSVLDLTYPGRELILCAGGEDGTYEVARRFAKEGVTVLPQQHGEGKQRALRRCLERASGEIIVLTDADCIMDDDGLRRLLGPLLQGEVAATGGSVPHGSPSDLCQLALLQHLRERYLAALAPAYSEGLLGRNCAVRRSALEATRALALPAPTGTDYRLARALLAAGHRIALVPESTVTTHYPCNPGAYVRQHGRWLRNLYVHGVATRDWRLVRHAALSTVTGATLLAAPLAVLAIPASWVVPAWALVTAHALLARVRQIAAGGRAAGVPVRATSLATLPLWLALDAWVWATTPASILSSRGRTQW